MSNLVYVLLGNGYYNENGSRYHPFTTHFGPETMIFHLVIEYNDGTRQTIDSDNSWFVQFSPVVYNSLFGGEDYDARLESPTASQETGISVSPWHPAMVQPAPKGVLRRQRQRHAGWLPHGRWQENCATTCSTWDRTSAAFHR